MNKLIPISVVEDHTGLKKSAIYQRIQECTFPPPRKIGRASRWVAAEVEEWINNLIANDDCG